MENLVPIKGSAIFPGSKFEARLSRDAGGNVHLTIGFFAKSKKYNGPGTGNDEEDTVINRGSIICASPVVIADTSSEDKTGFAVDIVIDSKKPSTGAGPSPEEVFFRILDNFEDKEWVTNIKGSFR